MSKMKYTLKYSVFKSLTETLGLSVEAAMNALKVPEDERIKYVNLLRE